MAVSANLAFNQPPKLMVLAAIALMVLPILIFGSHQQNMMKRAERP